MSTRSLQRRWIKAAVKHDHLSGKFSSDPELLHAQVIAAAVWADVITLTEVNYADRGQVLAEIPGFTLTRGHDGPDGESAILTRDTVWQVREWATQLLDATVPAARNRIVVVIALLEHVETGLTLLLTAGHLPASVEGSWRARTARVRAHLACMAAWHRVLRAWRRRHHPDGSLMVADWNLNRLRAWVRDLIRSTFPRWRLGRAGTTGDLGPRLISFAIGRKLRRLHLRVLRRTKASDHRGVRLTYTVRRRRKKEHR